MNMLDKNDIELRLLAGMEIELDGGYIRSPKIKDIIEIGEKKYNQYISYLLIDKDNFDFKGNRDEISNFYLVYFNCYHNEEFKDIFFNALKFIYGVTPTLSFYKEELFFYFKNEFRDWKLTNENFDDFQEIVKIATNTRIEKEDYNPGNEKAAKFIEKLKAIKANRPKPKEKINLHSIINGLSWRSNDINIFNIFDLTIYQLYQGFFASEKIDNYQFTLQGMYFGTVDIKKNKIPDIHWANSNK